MPLDGEVFEHGCSDDRCVRQLQTETRLMLQLKGINWNLHFTLHACVS